MVQGDWCCTRLADVEREKMRSERPGEVTRPWRWVSDEDERHLVANDGTDIGARREVTQLRYAQFSKPRGDVGIETTIADAIKLGAMDSVEHLIDHRLRGRLAFDEAMAVAVPREKFRR